MIERTLDIESRIEASKRLFTSGCIFLVGAWMTDWVGVSATHYIGYGIVAVACAGYVALQLKSPEGDSS